MEDDTDYELWFDMTEAEQEAEEARVMAEYLEWWNSMTPLEQYRHSRRRWLENMRRFRRIVLPALPFLASEIKSRQLSMVKLRHWHRTGIYPGDA